MAVSGVIYGKDRHLSCTEAIWGIAHGGDLKMETHKILISTAAAWRIVHAYVV